MLSNNTRGWGLWVDILILFARAFRSWKYYIDVHGTMAFLLDVASIVVISLEIDSIRGINPDPVVVAHTVIGKIFLALVIFHRNCRINAVYDG